MNDDIFKGKKIVLGVTGGIAAYKTPQLVRDFVNRGAEVKVVMTPSALEFVTPLTLSTLSQNDVIVNTFPPTQKQGTSASTWHINYGMWADLMVVAPATVNTIAKIAHGFCDNALTTLVSAMRAPILAAPAADTDMYENPVNINNIVNLENLGHYIVEAEEGFLASGLSGKGRMADLNKITDAAEILLSGYNKDLTGTKILVTAGPTFEDIDPVRFIGNRSSGKMGYSIAKAAFLRGAEVTLVSGPSSEKIYPEINLHSVRSAREMKIAVDNDIEENDILIMSAAVADYKPAEYKSSKIKKEDSASEIKLTRTDDILSSLNTAGKIVVGFALETDLEKENAKKKLSGKNLDMIVLNSLKDEGAGFEHDTNKITILAKDGTDKEFPQQSKFQTANYILTELKSLINI